MVTILSDVNTDCLPELIDYFTALDPARLCQSHGVISGHARDSEAYHRVLHPVTGTCAYCVGAHIAFLWDVRAEHGDFDFHNGKAALMERTGLDYSTLAAVMHEQGAPESPFGADPWEVSPGVVFQNMLDALTEPEMVSDWPVVAQEVEVGVPA